MSLFFQICTAIVTMAVVAIAIAVIRAQSRFDRTAREISETAASMRQSIERLDAVTIEARQLLDSLSGIVPSLQRSISRITSIADRTTNISNAVLEEIEAPLRTAVAVARGVRSGTSRFVERIGQRFHRRVAEHNGGNAA